MIYFTLYLQDQATYSYCQKLVYLPEIYTSSPLTRNSNWHFTSFFRKCRPRFSHNDMQCKLLVDNIVKVCNNKYFLLYN